MIQFINYLKPFKDMRGIYTIILLLTTLCSCERRYLQSPNPEVVHVDKELMESHDWSTTTFNLSCVESVQEFNNYYWCIYNNPNQFDSVLCVSMNARTYKNLKRALSDKVNYSNENFTLYYGHCEESIVLYHDY